VQIEILRQQRSDDLEIGLRLINPDPLDCLGAMPLEIFSEGLEEVFAKLVTRALWAPFAGALFYQIANAAATNLE
jgi:hypothetical protein